MIVNADNLEKLTDYCNKHGGSYEENLNNILAEYFLEQRRREDDK